MRFRFGIFELDERAGELRRAGVAIRIQPKPFELLRLLIRSRDRIVPTDELMAALWPDTIVSPASLNRAVSHARRALDDTGRGAVLKSVPKRGYRFVGEVVELDPDLEADSAFPSKSIPSPADAEGHAPRAKPPAKGASIRPEGSAGAGPDSLRPALEIPIPNERHRHFVGRRDALSILDAAREEVLRGQPRIAVIHGPAGIGKTRLGETFLEGLGRQGFYAVTGRCRDRQGMPAFWLWVQILRGLVESPPLRSEIGRRAASGELAALAPALQEFTPEVAAEFEASRTHAPDGSNEQQRFRFFDSSLRALRACAQSQPIVLLLEDIQWAGSGSLRLLEHIALELRGAPLMLVATARDEPRERGHPVDRTIALLRKQPQTDSIELSGLSRRGQALADSLVYALLLDS